MIKHLFEITISGTQISKSVSFKNISERLRNIKMLNSCKDKLQLNILKRSTNPMTVSINEAKNEANELVDRLVLLDNHNITALKYLGYLNEKDELVEDYNENVIESNITCVIENPLEYYGRDEIKNILNKNDNLGVLRTFRYALGINDRISQYLIFYGLLLVLKKEKQKEVDKFIKDEIKDIQIVSGKFGNETIITNIRNMIAHPANGMNISQLNDYVDNYILILKQLVINELKNN